MFVAEGGCKRRDLGLEVGGRTCIEDDRRVGPGIGPAVGERGKPLAIDRRAPAEKVCDVDVMREVEVLEPGDPTMRGRQRAELVEDAADPRLPEPRDLADLRQR